MINTTEKETVITVTLTLTKPLIKEPWNNSLQKHEYSPISLPCHSRIVFAITYNH